jgi:hypothetical protein
MTGCSSLQQVLAHPLADDDEHHRPDQADQRLVAGDLVGELRLVVLDKDELACDQADDDQHQHDRGQVPAHEAPP